MELSDKGGIKRVYALRIDDYSHKSLKTIFEKHISVNANVKTDNWKGYRPLSKLYNIEQELSNSGLSMPEMHIVIHQIKSWIRTIYSWVHQEQVEHYLNEFSFRINRSQFKHSIFHKVMERVILGKHISYQKIIVPK